MSEPRSAPALEEWRELSSRVIFDELWSRPALGQRDRSTITLAVLFALSAGREIDFHINRAHINGLSFEEMHEIAVHVAYYAGWPRGGEAVRAVEKARRTKNENEVL